jgi:hypothetical protein
MAEKYLGRLIEEDAALVLRELYPTIGDADASEILDHFNGDYRGVIEFLEKCYTPSEGDVVLQLAVHAHRIETEGLCGCLDGEDIELLTGSDGELSRLADEQSRNEEQYRLLSQLNTLQKSL